MPTGYTADIEKGITFNQFVLNCAKAFGACITMRDDPKNTPIPEEFKPETYDAEKVEEAKAELKAIKKITLKEAQAKADEEYEQAEKDNAKIVKEKTELRKKYNDMLNSVYGWIPPTDDHIKFKDFMIQQITDSMGWDCDLRYYLERKPTRLTGAEWLKQARESCEHDIEYHTKQNQEEIDRVKERNAWVKALRGSLKKG